MRDLPIACSLTFADLINRRGDLLPGLIARADGEFLLSLTAH